MKRWIFLCLLFSACSSSKEPAPAAAAPAVDNTVTRYVDTLQTTVDKAKIAQAKANAAVANTEKMAQEANRVLSE